MHYPTQASTNDRKIRILLDNSVMTKRSRMEWFKRPLPDGQGGFWPATIITAERVERWPKHEAEAEAILTIGRLLRENKLDAFKSMELACEAFRDYFGAKILDPFYDYDFQDALNPIERSRFINADLGSYIKKGEKKDGDDSASQIRFFKWLTELDSDRIAKIIEHRDRRGLTEFDIAGFKDLQWFKSVCQRFNSAKNLPDAFYLWTARRNQIDVFLTLDFRLIRKAESISKERSGFKIGVRVESPLQFLKAEGIENPDPYPFEFGRSYLMGEVGQIEQAYRTSKPWAPICP